MRASLGLRTGSSDVDRLVDALTDLARRGPAWTYALVDGRWAPTPDPRPADPFARDRELPAVPAAGTEPGLSPPSSAPQRPKTSRVCDTSVKPCFWATDSVQDSTAGPSISTAAPHRRNTR